MNLAGFEGTGRRTKDRVGDLVIKLLALERRMCYRVGSFFGQCHFGRIRAVEETATFERSTARSARVEFDTAKTHEALAKRI